METENKNSLNWEIIEKQITIEGNIHCSKKAILRNDTQELLGIVSREYKPIKNEQLLELAHSISKNGDFVFSGIEEYNNGKIITAFLENQNPNITLNGCPIKERLVLFNSHDGTRQFTIGTTSVLHRCSNIFYSSLKIFRQKHHIPLDVESLNISNLIHTYKHKKGALLETFQGMEKVKVDEQLVDRLIKDIHRMQLNDSRSIKKEELGNSPSMINLKQSIQREMRDLGNNAFGLFNGVTWYTSHEMKNSKSQLSKMNGMAHRINQKAYRFCLSLKKQDKSLHQ